MAEVLDVITKFTYEAQTAPLEKSISVIQNEINSIDKLDASIQRLEKLRASTDKSNITRINQLNTAIDNRKRKMESEVAVTAKVIQGNDKLRASLAQQGIAYAKSADQLDKFKASNNSAQLSVINLGRIIQDAPYGFIGFANNINPALESLQRLKVETGSTGGAIKALGASLIGGAGIGLAVSIVTSLLITFGDKLFDTSKEAKKAADSVDDLANSVGRLIDKQQKLAEINNDLFSDKSTAARRRQLQLQEALNDGSLASEEKTFGATQNLRSAELKSLEKKKQAYEQLTRFFEARAKRPDVDPFEFRALVPSGVELAEAEGIFQEAIDKGQNIVRAYTDKIDEIQIAIEDKQTEIYTGRLRFNKEQTDRQKKLIEDEKRRQEERQKENERAYQNALGDVDNQLKIQLLKDQQLQYGQSLLDTEIELRKQREQLRIEQGIVLTDEQRKLQDQEFNREAGNIKTLIAARQDQLRLAAQLKKVEVSNQFGKPFDAAELQVAANELDLKLREISITVDRIDLIPTNITAIDRDAINKAMQATRRNTGEIPNFLEEDAKTDKKRKENLAKIKNYAQEAADFIIDSYKQISDAQIALLDKEISVRETRVTQAEELAKRGNTEILKQETERLEAAQKKREEVAERQLQIDAVLRASSAAIAAAQAIQTVTNAGATGDPYSAAARIAAAIAALAAGFAFVTSLTQAFADGVIDLKGPGTEKSDSIPARLSKGESVMTAAETRMYKPYLLAMRQGNFEERFLHPYTYSNTTNDHATKKELATMNKHMERLIEATEGSYVNTSQIFDGNGLTQIVETNRKLLRRQWKG